MRQWNLPRRAPDDGSARFGPLRLVAAAAMLLGTVTVGLQGAAAQDETFAYDQDGVVWSVDYDTSIWSDETGTTGDLQLSRDDDTAALFSTFPESDDVVFDTCLDDIIPGFEDGASVEDSSTVDSGAGDGYVWELRDVTISGQDGQTLHVCYDLGGPVLWGLAILPPGGDDLDSVYELMSAVSVDGDPLPVDFGDGGSGGSTPEASDDTEASPAANDDSDATPESGSGDISPYESASFGYSFGYDSGLWTSDQEVSDGSSGGRDGIALVTEDDGITLYVEGSEEWTDTDDCVTVLTDEILSLADLTVDDVEETVDPETGDPIATSDGDQAIAAYTADGGVLYVACYAAPEGDLIVGVTGVVSGDEDAFFGDALPAIEDISGSLEFAS